MQNRREHIITEIGAVFILALISLLLRMIYIYDYMENFPNALQPMNDALSYWDLGVRIYREGWLLPDDGPFYQAPLYSYFLALLHHLGYHRVMNIVWIQGFIGIMNVILCYALARFYLPRFPALCAAILFGFCHHTIFLESKILSETLGLFLFLLFSIFYLLWVKKWQFRYLMISGLLFSLATVCRPNLLFTLPFLLLHLLFSTRNKSEKREERFSVMNRITPAVLFLLIVTLGILPVTLRNLVIGKDLVPICSNSGVTLYMGTNPLAEGGLGVVEGLSNNILDQHTESISLASRLAGEDLSPSEASNFWVGKTIRWVLKNPVKFIILEFKKILWALYFIPPAVNYSTHFEIEWIVILRYLRWLTFLSVALGWSGILFLLYKRNPENDYLLATLAGYFLLSLVYYASDRFLAGILPVTSIISVLFISFVWNNYLKLNLRLQVGFGISIILAIALAANPFLAWNANREVGLGWFNLGVQQAQRGNMQFAQGSYETGLKHYPNFPPLLLNLGVIYAQQNRLEDSTRLFQQVLKIDPNNQTASRNLEINRQRMK